MEDCVKEQLAVQLENLQDRIECMRKDVQDLGVKLWYGHGEWAEDADIMLDEVANAVGIAEEVFYTIAPQLVYD